MSEHHKNTLQTMYRPSHSREAQGKNCPMRHHRPQNHNKNSLKVWHKQNPVRPGALATCRPCKQTTLLPLHGPTPSNRLRITTGAAMSRCRSGVMDIFTDRGTGTGWRRRAPARAAQDQHGEVIIGQRVQVF